LGPRTSPKHCQEEKAPGGNAEGYRWNNFLILRDKKPIWNQELCERQRAFSQPFKTTARRLLRVNNQKESPKKKGASVYLFKKNDRGKECKKRKKDASRLGKIQAGGSCGGTVECALGKRTAIADVGEVRIR